MKKLIALAVVCASTAYAEPSGAYLTWMGYDAGQYGYGDYTTLYGAYSGSSANDFQRSSFMGIMSAYNSYYLCDTLGLGFRAMQEAQYATNVVALGSMAGRNAQSLDNCFFLGRNAGRDAYGLNNCFFVGTDAGRGVHDVSDRTYIDGQLYADKGSGSFYIRPTPGSNRDALTYSNGVLKIGARILSQRNERVDFSANLYLSEDGDDANDGLTLATAKRTIAGTVAAANAMGTSNIVVAVMDGEYTPPFSDFGADYTLTFRSVNGKETTRVVGGLNAVLSWTSHYCIWQGFTFTGFVGTGFKNDNTIVCRFGAMVFEDCDFVDNAFDTEDAYTAYQLCDFVRCRFYRNKYYIRDWNATGSLGVIFRGCYFYASTIDGMEIYNLGGSPATSYPVIWADIEAERCLFKLPCTYVRYETKSGKPQYRFRDVTMIAPSVHRKEFNNTFWGVSTGFPYPMGESVTNCFYVIGDFEPGTVYKWCGTAATNCIPDRFVACASADLTDESVAADESCPSVRDDGYKDYGWKSSVFGAYKSARRLAERLAEPSDAVRVRDPATGTIYLVSVDGGELNVSTVSNAVVEVTPPASNAVLSVSRPVLAASSDEEEEDDGTVITKVGKFTVVIRR